MSWSSTAKISRLNYNFILWYLLILITPFSYAQFILFFPWICAIRTFLLVPKSLKTSHLLQLLHPIHLKLFHICICILYSIKLTFKVFPKLKVFFLWAVHVMNDQQLMKSCSWINIYVTDITLDTNPSRKIFSLILWNLYFSSPGECFLFTWRITNTVTVSHANENMGIHR